MDIKPQSPHPQTHHHHHHHHSAGTSNFRLFTTMVLNFLITVVEVIGGLMSGSLSLLSDALHNFSDGIAIIISYIALRLSKTQKTPKYTFGLKRAEILAAIFNASTLVVICFFLFKESYERFISPQNISGGIMITVAGIGLLANVIGTLLLRPGAKENINIRAAYLHLLGDAFSSVTVIIGGVFIYFFQVYWLDPLLTVLISIYILIKSLEIIKEAINVLMMRSPENISIEAIQKDIESIPGVQNIHHVHIWRLNEQITHFEAHIDVKDMWVSETTPLSKLIEERLIQKYGISHITLQFESDRCPQKKLV